MQGGIDWLQVTGLIPGTNRDSVFDRGFGCGVSWYAWFELGVGETWEFRSAEASLSYREKSASNVKHSFLSVIPASSSSVLSSRRMYSRRASLSRRHRWQKQPLRNMSNGKSIKQATAISSSAPPQWYALKMLLCDVVLLSCHAQTGNDVFAINIVVSRNLVTPLDGQRVAHRSFVVRTLCA